MPLYGRVVHRLTQRKELTSPYEAGIMPSTGVTNRSRYVLGREDARPTAAMVLGLLRRGSDVLRVHLWPEAGIEDLLRCPGAFEGDRVFLDTQRVCCLQAGNGVGVGQFLRDNR